MGSIRSERRWADRLLYQPVGNALAHFASPEVRYGIDENKRLVEELRPYFDSLAQDFVDPSISDIVAAQELTDQLYLTSGSQVFGGLWLNRYAQDGAVLRITGFQENITETDALIRAFIFSRLNPNKQVLIVDNASHGLSDDYTVAQQDAMFGNGDLSEVGSEMAKAIANFAADNALGDVFDVSSFSYGARQALDVVVATEEVGLTVGDMRLFELPGTANGRASVHADYFLYEWVQDRMRFSTDWLDTFKLQFESFLDNYGDSTRHKNLPNFLGRDKRAIARNFWHSVLGYDTGLGRFVESLEVVQAAQRINGTASRIGSTILATSQFESIGGFDLYTVQGITHGGMGNVVTSPMLAQMDKTLARTEASETIHRVSPFDYIP